jgi:hypothetical protein
VTKQAQWHNGRVRVDLRPDQIAEARTIAGEHLAQDRARGFLNHSTNPADDLRRHWRGVIGEMAAAEYLGVHLAPSAGYREACQRHYDVGGIQVKAAERPDYQLIMQRRNCLDCIYVLAVPAGGVRTGHRINLVGWRTGNDIRRMAVPRDLVGQVWFVPQARLHPMPAIPPAGWYTGHHAEEAVAA